MRSKIVVAALFVLPAVLAADGATPEQPSGGPAVCAACDVDQVNHQEDDCSLSGSEIIHMVRSSFSSGVKINNSHPGNWYCLGCGEAVQVNLHTITPSSSCGGAFAEAEAAILLYAAMPGYEKQLANAVRAYPDFVRSDLAAGTLELLLCDGNVARTVLLTPIQRSVLS